jgi:hypothetical protein
MYQNRGRHLRPSSVIAITQPYDFTFSHNALKLSRIDTTSNSYRFEHIRPVIASYIYDFDIMDKRYRNSLFSLLVKIPFKSYYNIILLYFSQMKYTRKLTVIALGIKAPLSLLIVIALVTFWPLVNSLTASQKR